jgi:hypothetical protein
MSVCSGFSCFSRAWQLPPPTLKLDLALALELVPLTFPPLGTSVHPTAGMATMGITRRPARLTDITAPTISLAAFSSGQVRGSTASVAATTGPGIAITGATMTAGSVVARDSVTSVVGVNSTAAVQYAAADSVAR